MLAPFLNAKHICLLKPQYPLRRMTASKEYKEGRTAVRNPVASEKGPIKKLDKLPPT